MTSSFKWNDRWDSLAEQQCKAIEGPILIFGIGGFIGANLMRSLLARRDDVFGVTQQTVPNWRTAGLPPDRVLTANLLDEPGIRRLIAQVKPRTVFNLSAYGAYAHQDDSSLIYATNFSATESLIRILRQQGLSAYVHAGSSSEYGINCAGPDEQGALEPNSDYAVSKVACAYLLKHLGEHKGVPCINLRLYSIYGPFEDQGRLIPNLIKHGQAGAFPPMVNPDISRDFVYVDDATAAFVYAATVGVTKAPGASLNVASGKKTTIREIAAVAGALMKIPGEPDFKSMPPRKWDLKDWYGNPARAKQVLGWEAKIALSDGLAMTREWQAAQLPYQSGTVEKRKMISAIIACYKDEQAIPVMHERLTKMFIGLGVNYEIIFVNDCSPDNTRAVLTELAARDPHVVALEHTRNFGSQAAFVSGMEVSTGDAVVLLDGDLQDPPEVIPEFFAKWQEGHDVVYGVRVKREANVLMQLAYKAFYRVFQKLAYIQIPVDSGDFSLISRHVADQLVNMPERDQFLRGLRAWVGYKQTGVPYLRPERAFGVTTNNLRKNIWWAKKGIFSFTYAPLEWMGYGGAAVTLGALMWAVWISVMKFVDPSIPRGITSVTVTILFLAGVQLTSLAIIGEYIGKIFEEVKRRPKFIRRSIRIGNKVIDNDDAMRSLIEERRRLP